MATGDISVDRLPGPTTGGFVVVAGGLPAGSTGGTGSPTLRSSRVSPPSGDTSLGSGAMLHNAAAPCHDYSIIA